MKSRFFSIYESRTPAAWILAINIIPRLGNLLHFIVDLPQSSCWLVHCSIPALLEWTSAGACQISWVYPCFPLNCPISPNDCKDLNWVHTGFPCFSTQETQFVIDQGGQPTTTGAIFTFREDLRGGMMKRWELKTPQALLVTFGGSRMHKKQFEHI